MFHSRPSFRKPDEELENVSESRLTLRRNQEETSQLNRYQKLENPPTSMPPPPPSNNANNDSMRLHTSAAASYSKTAPKVRNENKSTHGIYSSNDSGFSNELAPVAPEVDYSDDDDMMPKKIPIR